MKYTSIFTTIALSALAYSCTKTPSIKISGSTTVLPVISKAADNYSQNEKNLKIIVNAGGSGVGINQLGEGKIDLGMSSRDITKEEINSFPNVNFNTISIGKDAVVPVVSSEIYNAGLTALSAEQLALIYLGKIENWKEVGGPDKEILCVDKEKARGTRHVFMDYIFGNKKADAPGADLVLGSNNEEQTAIVQSDAAIGMLSNAWLNDDVKGLSIITKDSLVIAPSLENIINGSYPISRDLIIITNGEPKGDVKTFVDYILSDEGQKNVTSSGYVSLKK